MTTTDELCLAVIRLGPERPHATTAAAANIRDKPATSESRSNWWATLAARPADIRDEVDATLAAQEDEVASGHITIIPDEISGE